MIGCCGAEGPARWRLAFRVPRKETLNRRPGSHGIKIPSAFVWIALYSFVYCVRFLVDCVHIGRFRGQTGLLIRSKILKNRIFR
jgi:hypothetical protein